jgi:xanthine/uracil permease
MQDTFNKTFVILENLSTKPNQDKISIIVGIVVGCCVLLVIGLVLYALVKKKKNNDPVTRYDSSITLFVS